MSVVVLGDSLSASVLGGSGSIKIKDIDYAKREGSLLRKLVLWAVEDHNDSWGTGKVNYSIVSRLESRGNTVNAFNTAISGGTVYDVLTKEIINVEKWKKSKKINQIDLALVFIGANDSCAPNVNSMTSATDFKLYYSAIAEYLKSSKKVVFIPLPDITSLYEFKDKSCMFGIKCKKIWEVTGSCANVMSGKDLPIIRERIVSYNKSIKEEAVRINALYVEKANMLKFEPKHISRIDGFHGNRFGQELISELVWEKLK